MELIDQVREYYNDDLELLGVLLNIADMRTTHSRDAYARLQETFGEKVFDSVIRASIAYAESAEKALSILDYRPDLGQDYYALADEVLTRVGLDEPRGALAPLLLH
jgi:chromosome partitioning protein